MTAVLASYVKMSTLVDGTMRIVLDVEPGAAADAFSLLGSPGTSIALARITKEAATAHDRRQQETAEQRSNHSAQGEADRLRVSEGSRPASASPASEKRQRTLAEKAAWYCKSPSFQDWLQGNHGCYDDALKQCDASYGPGNWSFEQAAKHTIYIHCGVTSRGDIIPGNVAGRLFLDLEAQFHDWQRRAA